jgi:Uma2 family endonuclease
MAMSIAIPHYTVEDLDHFPDDGNRYELLDGVLLVTPAPGALHQNIAFRLMSRLGAAVESSRLARVVGPGAIARPPGTQLQPDILVYPARFPIDLDWKLVDEHWLAVEILSDSSRVYDREFKRDAYFALGVAEVWLVDPRDRSVEVCRARGPGETLRDMLEWRVPGHELVVSVSLREVFEGLE